MSYNYEYESDVVIMEICKKIRRNTDKEEYMQHLTKLS